MKHLKKALEEREKRLAEKPESIERKLSVANACSSLGSIVRLADGNAISMLERARDIQFEHLPSNDDALVTTISRLGVALKDAGRFEEARPLYEFAFTVRRDKFGMDHIDTLFSYMNLAMFFDALGEHDAHGDIPAHDDIVEEVIRRRKSTLGVRHPHTLFARHRWGAVLVRQDKLEEAAKEMDDVCQLQASVFDMAHKETLSSRSLRAQIWHKQGRSDDARLEFLEVREELIRQEFSNTHVDTIEVTSKLAELLFDDNPAAGLEEHCRAVKGVLKTRGSAASPRLRSVLDSAEYAAQRSLRANAPDTEQGLLKRYQYLLLRWNATQLLDAVRACRFPRITCRESVTRFLGW